MRDIVFFREGLVNMEKKKIQELIKNREKYCVEENFVGIGSTRKVFKVSEYVIKIHKHNLGYKQSKNELIIYKKMWEKGFNELVAQTYYVDESLSIQKYYKPIALRNNQSYKLDMKKDTKLFPNKYEEILKLLEEEFDCFDLEDTSNYGLNEQGKLIFIDYGMTKKLYEEEWRPLAESGIIRQIEYDYCNVCGIKKELHIYGDNDSDRRCYMCGKE